MRSLGLCVALLACKGGSSAPPPPPPPKDAVVAVAPPKTVAEPRGTTDVRVDRRVELLSLVHRLGGGNEYRQAKPSPYVTAVDALVAKHEKHPAIEATRRLRARHGIGNDAVIQLAMHLDDSYAPVPDAAQQLVALDHRWKHVDVAAYATQVRDFATAIGFDAFFDAQRAEYAAVAEGLRARIDAENPVGFFDALFGKPAQVRYRVIPGMLTGPASYATRAVQPDGTLEMVQVIGLDEIANVEVLVHEMAHSYVDPLLATRAADLAAAGTALYPLVAPAMRRQKYTTWPIMLNESVVRALSVLYLKERHGDRAAGDAARLHVRAGFLWTNELVEVLRRFQRDRNTYPDIAAYMPKVVAFFDGLAKQYNGQRPPLPFMGPFDAVFDGPIVVAAPTTTWEKLAKYVTDIHAQVLATRGPLVAGAADTLAKHPRVNVVAYGTPESNPVIADLAKRASWSITPQGITLGKRKFAGATLVLIACWLRHDDPTKGIAVYAASSDKLLPGINSLRHGDKDWLIARPDGKGNHVIVASGDWPTVNGGIVPPE